MGYIKTVFTGAAPKNTSSAAKQPRILNLYPVAAIEGYRSNGI